MEATMNTMKTLVLAASTALSLGTGTAMAQEADLTYEEAPGYWAPSSIAARQAQAARAVQAGSSDVDALRARPDQTFLSNSRGTTVPNTD
jgi:hypothetical protein